MHRSAILTASLLSTLGLLYVGCTQNFDQFEPVPTGGPGSSASSAGGGNVGGAGGAGGAGGQGGGVVSSSGTGGTGGAGGGMPECTNNNDCPNDTLCEDWSCTAGKCVSAQVPAGTPIGNQIPGNCRARICNAMGDDEIVDDPTDVPADDGNPCTDEVCNGGEPAHPNEPAGTACMLDGGGMGKCDAMGVCIQCMADADCTGANAACVNNACVACDDGTMNGDETGVDCGGTHCKKCNGDACALAADCGSANCVDGVCCNMACTATCMACNVAGSVGTCSNLPAMQDDPLAQMACTGLQTCDGTGGCKLKNGSPCNGNNQCVSGKCGGNPKVCQP